MGKICIILIFALMSCKNLFATKIIEPTKGQKAMIERKYGMFLHFGMNTYLNAEWSDGKAEADIYNPPSNIGEKAAQWVKNAKLAGMRSIVLTTKHHDGFCLWDSKYTEYDIANPKIKNHIDILKAVSDACKKENIAFSVYYSLWDRHEKTYKDPDPHKYIDFMKKQLGEIMTNYGTVSELWFDGAWDRKTEDWYLQEVYDFVKEMQPNCQISTNWTLGKRPVDMQEGDSIIYFPADFRLWDPYLPVKNDPKVYSYKGKKYYLPFESTQTISVLGNWFAHPEDKTVRDLDELEEIFYTSTSNDNCLLLNIPPDINGEQNPLAIKRIFELAEVLGIKNGAAFPKENRIPSSLTTNAKISTSSIFKNDTLHNNPYYAIDSDVSTSWVGDSISSLDITLKENTTFNKIFIIIGRGSIINYSIQYLNGNKKWINMHSETIDIKKQPESFMGYGFIDLNLSKNITTNKIRIKVNKSNGKPTIYSFRIKKQNEK